MNIFKATIFGLAISSAYIFAAPSAEARVNITRQSCSQAKNLVQSKGRIVLTTGRNTYDLYVANHSYCETGDIAVRGYVRTRSKKSCFIGYTCQPYEGGRGKSKGNNGGANLPFNTRNN